jgi:molecular chaperone HscA
VKDNRKLAEFNLTGIPGMPAGLPKVEVSFLINADGILQVTAREMRSGVVQSIDVKPQYGLTDAEVEQMLMDSITHAKDDMKLRGLVEAQTEGKILLETTQNFIRRNEDFLSQIEKEDTIRAMENLNSNLSNGSKDQIQAAIETLNNVSRPYAERLMDVTISETLRSKKIK